MDQVIRSRASRSDGITACKQSPRRTKSEDKPAPVPLRAIWVPVIDVAAKRRSRRMLLRQRICRPLPVRPGSRRASLMCARAARVYERPMTAGLQRPGAPYSIGMPMRAAALTHALGKLRETTARLWSNAAPARFGAAREKRSAHQGVIGTAVVHQCCRRGLAELQVHDLADQEPVRSHTGCCRHQARRGAIGRNLQSRAGPGS